MAPSPCHSYPAGQPYLSLWTESLPQCTAKPSVIHMLPAPCPPPFPFHVLPAFALPSQKRTETKKPADLSGGFGQVWPGSVLVRPLGSTHSAPAREPRLGPSPALPLQGQEAAVSGDKELGVSCTTAPETSPRAAPLDLVPVRESSFIRLKCGHGVNERPKAPK